MDNTREKLIELFVQEHERCDNTLCNECEYSHDNDCGVNALVDHLIANGVTVQEWISVNDRLPDEDGKYLVFEQSSGRTNTSILRFAKDARKVDKYDFKGRWKNAWYEYDSEFGHYTVDSVTHWMPLPQPPKGE